MRLPVSDNPIAARIQTVNNESILLLSEKQTEEKAAQQARYVSLFKVNIPRKMKITLRNKVVYGNVRCSLSTYADEYAMKIKIH